MLNQAAVGLYRKDDWAFISQGGGSRLAVSRSQYELDGHSPHFDALQSEADFHEQMLGRTSGDND